MTTTRSRTKRSASSDFLHPLACAARPCSQVRRVLLCNENGVNFTPLAQALISDLPGGS